MHLHDPGHASQEASRNFSELGVAKGTGLVGGMVLEVTGSPVLKGICAFQGFHAMCPSSGVAVTVPNRALCLAMKGH